jgi:flagellar biosynthesis anti-sigma factor FlgM
MKVNDPNLSPAGAAGAAHASETARNKAAERSAVASAAGASGGVSGGASNDDVHLSELVRSLRSLAAESPERQAKIEHLARAYASGSYQVDAEATASAIVQDSTRQDSTHGGTRKS